MRGRSELRVYLFGERVLEFVDHPLIWPSVNAVAETYRLAQLDPDLGAACSSLSGVQCSRFLHVTETAQDVVKQVSFFDGVWYFTDQYVERYIEQGDLISKLRGAVS